MKNYQDVFKFPLMLSIEENWVYDSNQETAFQFRADTKEVMQSLLDIINGNKKPANSITFKYVNGSVYNDLNERVLTLHNWWFLTEIAKLSDEEALNVQNTLGEFIVFQLNR